MRTLKSLSKASIYFQVFFWVFYGLMGFTFTYFYEGSQGPTSLWAFMVNLLLHIAMANFHLLYLVPVYFSRRKYIIYGLFVLLLLLGVSLLKSGVFMLGHKLPEMPRISIFGILPGGAFITTILTFIITLPFLFIDSLIEKENLKERMRSERLEAQLRVLRSQINPHFLFNVLNNVYALIETGNRASGKVVLQLSDLMRHLMNAATEDLVSVKEEVKCLRAFIDMHLLQQSGTPSISFKTEMVNQDIQLPALLLITLLENAFKHSNWNDETGKGYICCHLKTDATGLHFHMVNGLSKKPTVIQRKQIGLANITERMDLLFPNSYELLTESREEEFVTELKLYVNHTLQKTA